ncbi:thymidylate synthase [Tropicibacter sp. Alg240-R139]|uniref:thymidylate synthase n=1 Tax=Tropicibacter sp. Alg240-R139 TaxID=2305991 RepID=UPI0013DF2C6F|nr:thymidylate synthase [Tropicibacter sp. Alg240-R139]
MKRFWLGIVAAATVSACGGDTFSNSGSPENPVEPTPTVPEAIAGDVTSVEYNKSNQTLTVTGSSLDNTPFDAVYTRNAGLDVPGYEAYTTQDSSLDRHFTAFAQERDGVYATVVGGGPQFNAVIMGSNFGRDGTYTAPDASQEGSGLVSYAGTYVGILNTEGDGGDLLAVTDGTAEEVQPTQIAEITGVIYINADFADNSINGIVYERVIPDTGASLEDLSLFPGTITSDGSFDGEVRLGADQAVGTYAGLFGGTDASAVAGALNVSNHIDGDSGQALEYGIFVLAQCGTANADAICNQPQP